MYMSISHEENEKTLEGTVPLKIGYFFSFSQILLV